MIHGFLGKTADANESFERLLAGESIECLINENLPYHRIYENGDNLWSALLETGYLTKTKRLKNILLIQKQAHFAPAFLCDSDWLRFLTLQFQPELPVCRQSPMGSHRLPDSAGAAMFPPRHHLQPRMASSGRRHHRPVALYRGIFTPLPASSSRGGRCGAGARTGRRGARPGSLRRPP